MWCRYFDNDFLWARERERERRSDKTNTRSQSTWIQSMRVWHATNRVHRKCYRHTLSSAHHSKEMILILFFVVRFCVFFSRHCGWAIVCIREFVAQLNISHFYFNRNVNTFDALWIPIRPFSHRSSCRWNSPFATLKPLIRKGSTIYLFFFKSPVISRNNWLR